MIEPKRKVLLVGWDAADWKVIHPLMDQGLMPALQSLVEQGCMGNISTLEPCFSPMLWTSIATGKLADKHGILGFTEPAPGGQGMRPSLSTSRKTKALWNILGQNGYQCNVVGWWPSHPAEPINGIMVSNHYHRTGSEEQSSALPPGTVHPPELSGLFQHLRVRPDQLTAQHIYPFVPLFEKVDQDKDRRLESLAKIISEATNVQSAATWIMDHSQWDFMGVYFDAVDHFSHGFMSYHPPRLPHIGEADFEIYQGVLAACYRFHDMMLGNLLKKAGPDTTVILISDHGFHSDHLRPVNLPDEPAAPALQHRDHGIFIAKGPGIKRDEVVHGVSLLNIAPTILSLFDLPSGQDMDGVPLAQIFAEPPRLDMIPSWDAVPGDCGMHPADKQTDPVEAQATLRQLVELGYIEDPGPDAQLAARKAEQECQYNLARVYLGSNRASLALPLLAELARRDAADGRFGVRQARAYLDIGEYTRAGEALDAFRTAAQQYQKDHAVAEESGAETSGQKEQQARTQRSIHYWLGQAEALEADLLLARGEITDAQNVLRNMQLRYPNSVGLQLKLAQAALSLGALDDATLAFGKVLEKNPQSASAHLGLAQLYLRKGEYEQAAGCALDAIGLDYYLPMAHFQLADALSKMLDWENSARAYEVVLAMQPGFALARTRLLEIYEGILANPEQARKHRNFLEQRSNAASLENLQKKTLADAQFFTKHLQLQNPIVVVSGLPRSGTSAMMQMLDRGGIDIFTDSLRTPDASNPRGYYEHEAVKSLARNNQWMGEAQGKAVKVIAQLLPFLPPRYNYKIIFMERELIEILASQHKMLLRTGRPDPTPSQTGLYLAFQRQVQKAKQWIASQPNVDVLYIGYADLLEAPQQTALRIAEFLGQSLNLEDMVKIVDKSLHREKSTQSLATSMIVRPSDEL